MEIWIDATMTRSYVYCQRGVDSIPGNRFNQSGPGSQSPDQSLQFRDDMRAIKATNDKTGASTRLDKHVPKIMRQKHIYDALSQNYRKEKAFPQSASNFLDFLAQ